AVSYVVVRVDLDQQDELMGVLDSSTELEKVTEGTRGGMWRVIDAAPRAVVRGGDAPIPLDSAAVDAEGTVPADTPRAPWSSPSASTPGGARPSTATSSHPSRWTAGPRG